MHVLDTSTPLAVLVAQLNTVAAFATLAVAQHRGLFSMGVLLGIAILFVLIVSLIVLPSFMIAIGVGARRLAVQRSAPSDLNGAGPRHRRLRLRRPPSRRGARRPRRSGARARRRRRREAGDPAVEYVRGSVADRAVCDRALDGVDRLYHLAGIAHLWRRDKDDFDLVNRRGTETLLAAAAAKGIAPRRALLDGIDPASEAAERQRRSTSRRRRSSRTWPGPYTRSKYLGEQAALDAARRWTGRGRGQSDRADRRRRSQHDAAGRDARALPLRPLAVLPRLRPEPRRRARSGRRNHPRRRQRARRRALHPRRRKCGAARASARRSSGIPAGECRSARCRRPLALATGLGLRMDRRPRHAIGRRSSRARPFCWPCARLRSTAPRPSASSATRRGPIEQALTEVVEAFKREANGSR